MNTFRGGLIWIGLMAAGIGATGPAHGQAPRRTDAGTVRPLPPDQRAKVEALVQDEYDPEYYLFLQRGSAKLIRTKAPVQRISIKDPNIVEVIQYGPNEFDLVGRSQGVTSLTLWIGGAYFGYRIAVADYDPRLDASAVRAAEQGRSKYVGPPRKPPAYRLQGTEYYKPEKPTRSSSTSR